MAKGPELLMLIALADRADDKDWTVWMGKNGLAKKTRMSRASITRYLRAATERGELKRVEQHWGRYHTTLRTVMPKYAPSQPNATRQ